MMMSETLKITIICGCLEPGADGVGDYSRILAEGAAALGCKIQLISIADRHTCVEKMGAIQIHRFQNALNDVNITHQVTRLIEETNPNWLSLQFVNFGFHPRGLLNRLMPPLDTWRQGRLLHVMFHECFLEKQSPLALKHNLLASIQKYQTKKAAALWRPDCIHTSNPYYQAQLQTVKIVAKKLPLFSNVKVHPLNDNPEGVSFIKALPDAPIFLFPFTQHRDWSPLPAMKRLKQLADTKMIVPQIIQVGKNQYQSKHWPLLKTQAEAYGWHHSAFGLQSSSVISALMQTAVLGVTSKHLLLAGKSGAVSAMHEHGLPVFFAEPAPTNFELADVDCPSGFLSWELSDHELAARLDSDRKLETQATSIAISQQWIETLQNQAV